MNISHFLPTELLENAISLHSLGVNEYGWIEADALSISKECYKSGLLILGGDVLLLNKKNGHIEYTYDNWYVNTDHANGLVEQSIIYSEEKVKFYSHIYRNLDENFCLLFALVFAETQ